MISGKRIFRLIFNRRTSTQPVSIERRAKKMRAREADEHLSKAIERLRNAIRNKNKNLMECGSAVVQFSTFAEVCNFRVPELSVRRCRNPKHEGGDCNERLCPFMGGAA